LVLRNDTTIQVAARYQTPVINRSQLERTLAGAILLRSDCASESADEVNASRTLLHRAVRQPDGMLSENTARIGGRRQSRWLRTADGFAV
jgi:hypothetical protein